MKRQKTLHNYLNSSRTQLNTILNSLYTIPKNELKPEELDMIRKDFTITERNGTKTILGLHETESEIKMPRFYGLDKFGPPKITQFGVAAFMNDQVACNIQLDTARQQPTAFEKVVEALKSQGRGGILSLPCGWGKTGLSIKIAIDGIKMIEGSPLRALFLVHNQTLLAQAKDSILKFTDGTARVGIIKQNKCEVEGMDFVVGSIQSLHKRTYHNLDSIGLVIIDEAHHMAAPMFTNALSKIPSKYLLALTATPRRKNAQETPIFHAFMGPVIFKPERAPDPRVIVRILNYAQSKAATWKFPKNAKDMFLRDLRFKKLIEDNTRCAIIAQELHVYYEDMARNIVVISERLDLIEKLISLLMTVHKVDISHIGILTGSKGQKERDLERSKRIIFSTRQISEEGLDCVHLNTLFIVLPLKGVEQCSGRILRSVSNLIPPHIVYVSDPVQEFENIKHCNVREWKQFGYTMRYEDTRHEDTHVDDNRHDEITLF